MRRIPRSDDLQKLDELPKMPVSDDDFGDGSTSFPDCFVFIGQFHVTTIAIGQELAQILGRPIWNFQTKHLHDEQMACSMIDRDMS